MLLDIDIACYRVDPLLRKGVTPDMPSRVINIASMAGIGTTDNTADDDGGLSSPGHGTFSCPSPPVLVSYGRC